MKTETNIPNTSINILLADDDRDGHSFFGIALETTTFNIQLVKIQDGEELMSYLYENSHQLPDVLFLHHDMPCDYGPKCLSEIKNADLLKDLPVIIYSATLHDDVIDVLYDKGAHYYICMADINEFKKIVETVLIQIAEKKFLRPAREAFILSY